MNIGILGSGRVGATLGTALAVRHGVVFGVRDPAKARAAWQGPAVEFVTVADAIARAAVIINATPGESSLERLAVHEDALAGKILVDVSNATRRGPDGAPGELVYPNSSLAEELQATLARTHVVKTLNTMLFSVMANPAVLSGPATVFLSGDDNDAKNVVRALLADLHWQDATIEDLGGIRTARGPEAFMLFVPPIIAKRGFAPFALSIAR